MAERVHLFTTPNLLHATPNSLHATLNTIENGQRYMRVLVSNIQLRIQVHVRQLCSSK